MIKWLRRKLYNFVMNNEEPIRGTVVATGVNERDYQEDNTLRFNVTPARGGVIVSVRTYDRRKDETDNVIHVIHDDESVSERVAEIVSMELLRR